MAKSEGMVTIVYGVHDPITQKLAGRTPKEVKKMLQDTLNIDPEAESYVNGEQVPEGDYLLKDGDRLEFSRKAGSKG